MDNYSSVMLETDMPKNGFMILFKMVQLSFALNSNMFNIQFMLET